MQRQTTAEILADDRLLRAFEDEATYILEYIATLDVDWVQTYEDVYNHLKWTEVFANMLKVRE